MAGQGGGSCVDSTGQSGSTAVAEAQLPCCHGFWGFQAGAHLQHAVGAGQACGQAVLEAVIVPGQPIVSHGAPVVRLGPGDGAPSHRSPGIEPAAVRPAGRQRRFGWAAGVGAGSMPSEQSAPNQAALRHAACTEKPCSRKALQYINDSRQARRAGRAHLWSGFASTHALVAVAFGQRRKTWRPPW